MSNVKTDVLAYWGQACERASKGGYYCWAQLHKQGLLVAMIGPEGDRAEAPIQWTDLAQAADEKGSIDAIIAVLRKEMAIRKSIVMPAGGLLLPS